MNKRFRKKFIKCLGKLELKYIGRYEKDDNKHYRMFQRIARKYNIEDDVRKEFQLLLDGIMKKLDVKFKNIKKNFKK